MARSSRRVSRYPGDAARPAVHRARRRSPDRPARRGRPAARRRGRGRRRRGGDRPGRRVPPGRAGASATPVLETHPRWDGVPDGEPIPTLVLTEPAPTGWTPPPGLAFGADPGDPRRPRRRRSGPGPPSCSTSSGPATPPPVLRPRWARPGWRAGRRTGCDAAAADAGRPLTGEPRPFFLRGISALLRAPTDGGDVFLKAVFPTFHAEPVITKLLADRFPATCRACSRSSRTRAGSWSRTSARAGSGACRRPTGRRRWRPGARTLIEIQRTMADRPDDLADLLAAGAPHRRAGRDLRSAFAAALGGGRAGPRDRAR